jgi:hypothetical protein
MSAAQLQSVTRTAVAVAAVSLMAGAAVAVRAAPAQAGPAQASERPARAAPALTPMAFGGYTFELPRSWPVIKLSAHRHRCVRFDRQAVYLGRPGRNESCPAALIGTTQALLIERGPARSVRSAVQDPVDRQITVTAPRVRIIATYSTDPGQIYRILRSASLPEPAGETVAARQRPGIAAPDLPSHSTDYHGRGFDACTAPSTGYMRAWRRHSPYRAVGIYIGGSDRACAQPNLTRSWLRREAGAGWHFIPLYVGPQAEYGELSSPAEQGTAAAADAVTQAELLGFPRRTPLYYDMEAYPSGDTDAVLSFLSAWTVTIHQLGYDSGVYSSSSAGVADLAAQYFRGTYTMPDVIYDALWNGLRNTHDPVFKPHEWSPHRRLHQYNGNTEQTFGGDTIDIDQDYLNVSLASSGGTGGTVQASPSVRLPGGDMDVFYRGSDRRLWRVSYRPAAGWAAPVDMGGSLRSAPTAVNPGGNRLDAFYQGTDGELWQVSYRPGRGWRAPVPVPKMGVIGGAPTAVAGPAGTIDVFWKGSADPHLWHARFRPGGGWAGPQRLGGTLASSPSPAEPLPGLVEVFWTGADRNLWRVTSRAGSAWSRPASLGMGPLGGSAQASTGPDGAVSVAWRGAGNDHLWLAGATPAGRWTGPHDLRGQLSLAPFPVTAASGLIRVLLRGPGGRLWQVVRPPGSGWQAPASLPAAGLRAAPFAAIGGSGAAVEVFWRGARGALWAASLRSGDKWAGPVRLAGQVA